MNDNLKLFFDNLFGQMPLPEWHLLKDILEPIEIAKGADITQNR
jgi:hypothetical protein